VPPRISQNRAFLSTDHVVCQGGIDLSTSTHAPEGVEHAGAHEADEGDHQKLDLGRGVPRQREAEEAYPLVLPSGRQVERADGLGIVERRRGGVDGRLAGLLLSHCERSFLGSR
jgi:hypothetical protein